MKPRADEPPDLLDHDWRGDDNADVHRDLQLVEHTARGLQVDGVVNPRVADQKTDDPAGDEESSHGRNRPGDEGNDQDSAKRLEVLDDRHPFILDWSAGPRRALQDPTE